MDEAHATEVEGIEYACSIKLDEVKKECSDKMKKAKKDHIARLSKAKNVVAELKRKYEDAKYEGSLWARDQTLSLHSDATGYCKWMGDDNNEEMADIVCD